MNLLIHYVPDQDLCVHCGAYGSISLVHDFSGYFLGNADTLIHTLSFKELLPYMAIISLECYVKGSAIYV